MEISPVDFLIGFIVINLLLKVAYPLSGLVHELGHACAGLLLHRQDKVRIYIGRHGQRPTLALGRLELYVGPTSHFWGTCEIEADFKPWQVILVSAAGPLVSCTLAGLGLWGLFNSSALWGIRLLAGVFFYANCKLFVVSAVPKHIVHPHAPEEKSASDGLKILQALGGKVDG